jgi:pyridoxal phosphate-dependent aminotransferase EpsN
MSPKALQCAFLEASEKNQVPKAVIVVNLYGQSADMDAILQVCAQYQVPVIEDAAESLGASYKGKASGTLADVGIYSFNGNKIITTSGGGMLVTNDEQIAAKAKFLSTQAREPVVWYEHQEIGYNYRMSNILAGVGRGQLKVLDDRVHARRAVFDMYQSFLGEIDIIQWMPEADFGRATRWLTALTVEHDHFDVLHACKSMAEENIEVRPLWKPMHQQPVFLNRQYFEHECGHSVSETLFAKGLCLPSGSNLSEKQVLKVSKVLRTILEKL